MKELNKIELPVYNYWNEYTEALELGFSEEEIKIASEKSGLKLSDVSEVKGFDQQAHVHYKVHQFVKESHQYHETQYCSNGKQLMESKTVSGIGVRVSSHYQGGVTEKMLMALMKARFDWFDSFTINKSYTEKPLEYALSLGRLHLSKLTEEHKALTGFELIELSKSEIKVQRTKSAWLIYDLNMLYLNTKDGSIYVPLKALLDSDIDLVKDTMTEYFKSYHSDKSKVSKSLLPLKSKEFNLLKKYLTI